MKERRFSEERIIDILKEQQAGLPIAEICRRHGVKDATFYMWRSRFGGMEVSDASRLKALDVATLREALGKTADTRRTKNRRDLDHRGEGLFVESSL